MIVGNGLIASAFIKARFHSDHHVIFASGVSNSSETNRADYQREIELIKSHIAKNTTFVYFSTTSIFDPSRQDSVYITHKKYVEHLIKDKADSFIIVRLPIMVSRSNNPHTLINFLCNAIIEQVPVSLHRNACRQLLDIDDLVPLLIPYLTSDPMHRELNIPGSEKITVPDLVHEIESILNIRGQYRWLDIGPCYDIPKDAGECLYLNDPQYIKKILSKYLDHKKTNSTIA